jgi:hypothetical protein
MKAMRVKVETESGTLDISVRQGCFGAWVAASPAIKNPINPLTRIRPVRWVADLRRDLPGLLG